MPGPADVCDAPLGDDAVVGESVLSGDAPVDVVPVVGLVVVGLVVVGAVVVTGVVVTGVVVRSVVRGVVIRGVVACLVVVSVARVVAFTVNFDNGGRVVGTVADRRMSGVPSDDAGRPATMPFPPSGTPGTPPATRVCATVAATTAM